MDAETQGVKLARERPAAKEELRHDIHMEEMTLMNFDDGS